MRISDWSSDVCSSDLAGGQRVEAAGVAGLACAEQVAHPLQRLVGTQAARLVEQQDAVEAAEPGTRRFAHAVIVDACALVGAASAASFAGHAKDKGSVGWVERSETHHRVTGVAGARWVSPLALPILRLAPATRRRRCPANPAAGCRCEIGRTHV